MEEMTMEMTEELMDQDIVIKDTIPCPNCDSDMVRDAMEDPEAKEKTYICPNCGIDVVAHGVC